MGRLPRLAIFAAILAALLSGCRGRTQVVELVPEVLASYPHDAEAFTQGLVYFEGRLFESTGLFGGLSSLREVELETGVVKRIRPLEPELFGEGLARVGSRLIQLTWRNGRALTYDLETFDPLGEFRYATEGWGLCYDGRELYMSDGSATLFVRDPDTFEVKREIAVTLRGEPLRNLNELECGPELRDSEQGEILYANVWLERRIVGIDKRSGRVVAEIDASGLLSPAEWAALGDDAVLNGVAYIPERKTFLLTGKLWPTLFEVRFVPRG